MATFTMNNSKTIKSVSLLITFLVVILGALAIWFLLRSIIVDKQEAATNTSVEVDKKLYEEITSPAKFGTDISTDEPGYGRVDPFAKYK